MPWIKFVDEANGNKEYFIPCGLPGGKDSAGSTIFSSCRIRNTSEFGYELRIPCLSDPEEVTQENPKIEIPTDKPDMIIRGSIAEGFIRIPIGGITKKEIGLKFEKSTPKGSKYDNKNKLEQVV